MNLSLALRFIDKAVQVARLNGAFFKVCIAFDIIGVDLSQET